MKKTIIYLLGLLLIAAFLSCNTEAGMVSIRMNNSCSQAIREAGVYQEKTSATFGRIEAGKTTSYKIIDNERISVSGTLADGTSFSGGFNLYSPNYFTSKWTVTVTNSLNLALTEDK